MPKSPESADHYRWIALSNTTLGVLMATINSSIVIISLPAIFRGIGVNPLGRDETAYLLWLLMGYMVVTSVFLISFGRISDIFGRVKLYNLGFLVFTLGSVLLALTPGRGNQAALYLILIRLVQGIGAGFLFANSTAILTDAFPHHQRGLAMGLNQVAAIAGSLLGLVLGGVLAAVDWRLVFLVSVPVGLFGTVWAYLRLKEGPRAQSKARIDLWGNLFFAVGLTVLLVALTYGIMPYGTAKLGWGNPWVVAGIVAGVVLLGAFLVWERRVKDPMLDLSLFRIRMFAAANLSGLLAAIARGGLQFMLIIWLQGLWLPLHGFSFAETPLWAGIYLMPMMIGFLVMGPISGALSDRYGAREFATGGMILNIVGFLLLATLHYDFIYWQFVLIIVLLGFGQGMFASPNATSIMNAVPSGSRGVASGMRATMQNGGGLLSMALFFSIVIVSLAGSLPQALSRALLAAGLPATLVGQVANLPPTAALFAAFLGYNPMASLLPPAILQRLPAVARAHLLAKTFFARAIAPAFMGGLRLAFEVSAVLAAIAAVASLLRGRRYVHEIHGPGGQSSAE